MIFINRINEIVLLEQFRGRLGVVYGRRRVGKTSLLREWGRRRESSDPKALFAYTQAIESSPDLQLAQAAEDITPALNTGITPKRWEDIFELIEKMEEPITLVIDEFPYIVASDPSIPSRFQRYLDHSTTSKHQLVLCGSSTQMMFSSVLSEASPLFGRATLILSVQPMGYIEFCTYAGLTPTQRTSFVFYSLVGGLPKYWELLNTNTSPVAAATSLYFTPSAYMEGEPRRLLRDEKIDGVTPLSILEAIGRGANRPNEIGARTGMSPTTLSKVFQALHESAVIEREVPFGENHRNSKRALYTLRDPSLAFWFTVFSPHRSRWHTYSEDKKELLLTTHASKVLENEYRRFLGLTASRLWEGDIEIDAVRENEDNKTLTISEVKWRELSERERDGLRYELNERFTHTSLGKKRRTFETEVLSFTDVVEKLASIAQ